MDLQRCINYCTMKRNDLPESPDHIYDEQKIVDDRLNELFCQNTDKTRRVSIISRGFWLSRERHVKIESNKGISLELITYSPRLKYHYMEPFEALFSLETNNLMIYYNGFPLSLAEAYHLLLIDSVQFRNYRVFQQLNRSGFICLKPSTALLLVDHASEPFSESSPATCSKPLSMDGFEVSTQFDKLQSSLKEVLFKLRELGPKDKELPKPRNDYKSIINFEVYRRQNFSQNKPRKDKQGTPDYYLIVCDKSNQKYDNLRQITLEYSNLKHKFDSSKFKLIIALVDIDNSICYAQFKHVDNLVCS